MTGLRFGVWLPTYAWADAGPEQARRLAASVQKCEEYGFDIWVIDHLLTASGLYGVAWLEPLSVLAYASALTTKVRAVRPSLVRARSASQRLSSSLPQSNPERT